MTRFNQRNIATSPVATYSNNIFPRGNSYVYDWMPDNRIPDTKKFYRPSIITSFPINYIKQGSVFVVAGLESGNSYATSSTLVPDITTWTTRSHPLSSLTGITFINNVWYACGSTGIGNGAIYTSTDAITWTLRVGPLGTAISFSRIFGRYNPGLSRYEVTALPYALNNNLYSSVDNGVTWTTTAVGGSLSTGFDAVYNYPESYSNFTWYAGGSSNGYLYAGTIGPYTPTYGGQPFGTTYVTATMMITVFSTSAYAWFAASQNGLMGFNTSSTLSPPTLTLVQTPPLSSGEYITDIFRASNANIGTWCVGVCTSQNRVFITTYNSNPSEFGKVWVDYSPNNFQYAQYKYIDLYNNNNNGFSPLTLGFISENNGISQSRITR